MTCFIVMSGSVRAIWTALLESVLCPDKAEEAPGSATPATDNAAGRKTARLFELDSKRRHSAWLAAHWE